MERQQKSILEMAGGAFLERADYEMKQILDNIRDANTSATTKRKMTIIITFEPDDERKDISTRVAIKTSLAPTNPIRTTLYFAGENSNGVPQVVEMTPHSPGQLDMFGGEQGPQAVLRMIQPNGAEDAERIMATR
jgi:hypothetical protein